MKICGAYRLVCFVCLSVCLFVSHTLCLSWPVSDESIETHCTYLVPAKLLVLLASRLSISAESMSLFRLPLYLYAILITHSSVPDTFESMYTEQHWIDLFSPSENSSVLTVFGHAPQRSAVFLLIPRILHDICPKKIPEYWGIHWGRNGECSLPRLLHACVYTFGLKFAVTIVITESHFT